MSDDTFGDLTGSCLDSLRSRMVAITSVTSNVLSRGIYLIIYKITNLVMLCYIYTASLQSGLSFISRAGILQISVPHNNNNGRMAVV